MPANPPLLLLGMLLGMSAGLLLSMSQTPAGAGEEIREGDSKAQQRQARELRDARYGRGALFFFAALVLGLAAFALGFIGWQGESALSNAPIGERQGGLESLNSRGLMMVAAAYILGYMGARIVRLMRARKG